MDRKSEVEAMAGALTWELAVQVVRSAALRKRAQPFGAVRSVPFDCCPGHEPGTPLQGSTCNGLSCEVRIKLKDARQRPKQLELIEQLTKHSGCVVV